MKKVLTVLLMTMSVNAFAVTTVSPNQYGGGYTIYADDGIHQATQNYDGGYTVW